MATIILVETVKANHLEPYDYIECLLETIPNINFVKIQKNDDFYLEVNEHNPYFKMLTE